MSAFYTVNAGATIATGDANQYANQFNGAAPTTGFAPVAVSNTTLIWDANLPSVPASDSTGLGLSVTSDTTPARIGFQLLATGYGALMAGTGSSTTAHLKAISSGWSIPESLTISGALTVSGSTSIAGLNTTGNTTIGGSLVVSGSATLANAFISSASGVLAIQNNTSNKGIGFTRADGTNIAEFLYNGNMTISGSTYYTSSSHMDSFHVAETYPVTHPMSIGTVCCPDATGTLSPCMHDACPLALIRCTDGGFSIGRESETDQYCALAGRVPVKTRFPIPAGAWVTADGRGGVRRLRVGEASLALGYALTPAKEGTVLILYRPTPYLETLPKAA